MFTFDLLSKNVDFQSPITSDWWNYLLRLGDLLIETAPDLKGLLLAKFSKYIPFNDFDLIIKLYKMIWSGIETCTVDDFKKNCKDLLWKHFQMNGNISSIIKFIKKADYSLSIFMAIYYEFIKNKQSCFMIRLALITVSRSIIKDTNHILKLSEDLLMTTINYTDFLGLYRNLSLLMELRILPYNVEIILCKLCEHCEIEYSEHFIKLFSKYQNRIATDSEAFGNLLMKPQIQFIAFKEPTNLLSSTPTAFNCLSLLLKLMSITVYNEIRKELDLFIGYLRLEKGSKDEYFNFLFMEQ